jgi:hypothetical protein
MGTSPAVMTEKNRRNKMESAERRFNALDFLLDYSKGTLWWVNDLLWKEADDNFVVKRKGHPGLSLARRKAESLYDVVPMLIGTTKNGGRSVTVENITEPVKGSTRRTHFSVVRPYPLRFGEFGKKSGIYGNDYKPRISDSEMALLNVMLEMEVHS